MAEIRSNKKKWYFFIKDDQSGLDQIFAEQECLRPGRTKNWKTLNDMIDSGKVSSIGYTFERSDLYTKEDFEGEDGI